MAVSGNLRVRNATHSLATRLQALEYMLAIHASRIGLDQLNAVNIISGAFGVSFAPISCGASGAGTAAPRRTSI